MENNLHFAETLPYISFLGPKLSFSRLKPPEPVAGAGPRIPRGREHPPSGNLVFFGRGKKYNGEFRRNEGCFPLISSQATKSMENNLHFTVFSSEIGSIQTKRRDVFTAKNGEMKVVFH